ncbi:MAG: UvrD-helicase domain-containing protein, partial [Gammaproteobacteria bacterium]
FLVREENRTRVFSTSLRVATFEEGLARLDRADLSQLVRERYRKVLDLVIHADAGEGLSTDELVIRAGIPPDECFRTLQNLERLGILANDLGLRVVLRTGVMDAAEARLTRVCEIERALVEVMAEAAPDAEPSNEQVGTEQVGSEQVLTLSGLCQGVREQLEGSGAAAQIIPDGLMALLRTMAHAFGGAKARRAMLDIRKPGSGEWRVRVRRPWRQIREITETRRAVAHVLLRALCAKLPAGLQSADAIVECKARDLTDALRSDLDVAARLRDPDRAIEQGLLYLHETEVLILDQGRTVFRSAMTIRLLPGSGRFSREDYAALERHYKARNLQIHVIDEFARRGARKIADALALVAAYFSWGRDRFVAAYFAGRKELLEFATTAESYRRIVEALRNPVQERLVQARDTGNHLVLAGPGSGKTTVVVHRVAYLLRVLRAAPESIIALTFNRSAAIEVRKRLHDLVGNDAHGVTVLTYHAMALRLTGVSLARLGETGQEPDFEALIGHAVD